MLLNARAMSVAGREVTNPNVSRTALERPTKEGDSPVSENVRTSVLLEASQSYYS